LGHLIPSIEGPETFRSRGTPEISAPSPRPVSALRARIIEDMTVRKFTEETRNNYIRNVRVFAAFIGRSPDTATASDLCRFHCTRRRAASAAEHLFTVTNSAVSALRFRKPDHPP
jgi:integrase/recombinase XerD